MSGSAEARRAGLRSRVAGLRCGVALAAGSRVLEAVLMLMLMLREVELLMEAGLQRPLARTRRLRGVLHSQAGEERPLLLGIQLVLEVRQEAAGLHTVFRQTIM